MEAGGLDAILPGGASVLPAGDSDGRTGDVDALKYLEVERGLRAVVLESLATERGLWRSIFAIERVLGIPLVLFEDERDEDYPHLSTGDEGI